MEEDYKKLKSGWNLKFEEVDYWVVSSSFNSNLVRIFKSYKSARKYLGQLKKHLIENIEGFKYLELKKDEDEDGDLTIGFWLDFSGPRYELSLFKLTYNNIKNGLLV